MTWVLVARQGIGAIALHHLNQALLPGYKEKVKIIEPYQMLGEVEEPLWEKLQLKENQP